MRTIAIPIWAVRLTLWPRIRMSFFPGLAPHGLRSARLAKPRIGQNGENVGDHVEHDECGGEDEPASLDHRHVMFADFVDHQLAEAGIDEHGLDDDDANDEIGEV